MLLELLLRGIAVGAQLGLGVGLFRKSASFSLRFATAMFIGSNTSFLLIDFVPIFKALGAIGWLLWGFSIGGAGAFWLFAYALFQDRPLTWGHLLPFGLLVILGICGQAAEGIWKAAIWSVHNVCGLALAIYALRLIYRSGLDDLVEARRQLRVPFLIAIAGFSMLLSIVQLGQLAGLNYSWYPVAGAAIQVLFGLCGIAILLEARPELFGQAVPRTLQGDDAAAFDDSAIWLDRLAGLMDEQRLWQREGLTIADTARAMGLPEHKLRKLINHRLGHRNFADYINQRRIDAAKQVLGDPANIQKTIAGVAFDHGFASLGPFNRAFRQATGLTPSTYRKLAMAKDRS